MSALTLAVIYSSISLFSLGLNNGISKKYTTIAGPIQLIIYRNITIVTILFISVLFTLDSANFDFKYMLGAFLLSVVSYFGLFFFMKGLEVGKVGIIAPVSSARIILTSFIGIVLLNDSLTTLQFFIIGIIFVGTILISLNIKAFRQSDLFNKKSGVQFALLAALFWGATFPFFTYFSQKLGAFLFSLILEGTVLFMSIVLAKLTKEKFIRDGKFLRLNLIGILFIGISGLLGSLCMNFAYKTGEISIASAITGANPMVATLYAFMFYKEKLNLQQIIAILFIIGGIILLSLV